MKLIELEIDNLRGIPYLILKPNGNNFLVFGPNGSGKSTIVDATDFLLTGQISRMTDAGTKDIKLKEHGPHIDSKPEDVCVRGVFEIQGFAEPVEIKRSLLINEKHMHLCINWLNIQKYNSIISSMSLKPH